MSHSIPESDSKVAIVIGASGGIGRALVERYLEDSFITQVVAISQSANNLKSLSARFENPALATFQCDYLEQSIANIVQDLEPFSGKIHQLCICNGVLHGDGFFPERRIEELTTENLSKLFQINTITPMIWLKNMKPLLKAEHKVSAAVLSARVGSIGDNRLGGWYSYRSSKAALNMLLKTLSIEFSRSMKNVQLYAFHPGTTDTLLSKPFQSRVPKDKLFEPQFVANQLVELMMQTDDVGEMEFVDWQHKSIQW